MNKPRILFDLDDTLTDFLDELVSRYNRKYGTSFTKEHCYKWELNEIFENNILELIDEEDFFEHVKPKEGAVKYMKEWIESNKYDIFIVTSCLKPENYIKKIKWFEKHMPFFPKGRIVPLTEKSAMWGNLLIDDKPKNLIDWGNEAPKDMPKMGILFDAPHNRDCNDFIRVRDYQHLNDIIKVCFE